MATSSGSRASELAGAVAHLRRADPVLAEVIDAHRGFDPRAWLTELPPLDAFGALVFQVIGQQLSVAATRRTLARLQGLFGETMPTPQALLSATPESLRQAGLSQRKVATIRGLARRFVDGSLDEAALETMSDDEVGRALTAVPGVGPWTVNGFLIIALNRPDVVLSDDLALRRVIQRVYRLDEPPSPDQVLKIAEPWQPYRSLATAYLFQDEFGVQ